MGTQLNDITQLLPQPAQDAAARLADRCFGHAQFLCHFTCSDAIHNQARNDPDDCFG